MLHYTLNTGHTRVSPRSEVDDEIIEKMKPFLTVGEHELPGELHQYVLEVENLPRHFGAVLRHNGRPIIAMAIAATPEAEEVAWPAFEWFYERLQKSGRPGFEAKAVKPESTPWLAVIVLNLDACLLNWCADFERCLAYTYLESLVAKVEG